MYEDDAFISEIRTVYRTTRPDLDALHVPDSRSASARLRRPRATLVGFATLGLAASLVAAAIVATNEAPGSVQDEQVATGKGEPENPVALQYFASYTAKDWVTNADEVVLADVGAGRDGGVSLTVAKSIWSSSAKHPALSPDISLASDRFEKGTYVVALRWFPALCATPGDPAQPAHWVVLGPGGLLRVIDDKIMPTNNSPQEDSLASTVQGRSVDALAPLLDDTSPRERKPVPGTVCGK